MTEENKTAPQDATGVSDDELRIAYEGPALVSNRFIVTMLASGARIVFAEQYGPNLPVFRSAVFLSHIDAIELKDLLGRMLVDVEKKIKEQTALPKDKAHA